jgi:glycine C-acetyltransferase
VTDKLGHLEADLASLREAGLASTIRTIEGAQGAWLTVDGRTVLNFCSNNYLGLANDPRLAAAAKAAIDRHGVGPAAVRPIAGTMTIHTELEQRLAEFKGVEAALSFQSGFGANLGTVAALAGDGDAIVSDALNHASIVDGVRLSRAARYVYDHADIAALRQRLQEARSDGADRILVITDGVFSMDGDIAPLDQIVEVADAHDAMVMVDDAHGEGVLGAGGRGIVDHFGLHGRVEVEVGTMSKAFGVVGGYVAGPRLLIDWLRQRARPFLFSSAATPADVAACIAAVDAMEESTELVDRLWANAAHFQEALRAAGFSTGHTATPITPVIVGDETQARELSRRLFEEQSVFAQAISYPMVPMGTARIRVMVSAAHSTEDLDKGIEAFTDTGRSLGII